MPKLKELFDAAKAADEKVQEVMQEMISAFEDGTEEGKLKALDLRPALDEAKVEAEKANLLYISARDAEVDDPDNAARKFVPVPGSENSTRKQMTRDEFEALSAADRMTFMLADGKLIEE
jgi:hypothetical protein